MLLLEVPVAYPFQQRRLARYSVREGQVGHITTSNYDALPAELPVTLNQRLGAASLSRQEDGAIITTCGHPIDGDVVVVTRIKGDERVIVEYDLGVEVIARIQCFDNDATTVQLLLVDIKGNLMKVVMDKDSLEPDECTGT